MRYTEPANCALPIACSESIFKRSTTCLFPPGELHVVHSEICKFRPSSPFGESSSAHDLHCPTLARPELKGPYLKLYDRGVERMHHHVPRKTEDFIASQPVLADDGHDHDGDDETTDAVALGRGTTDNIVN